ncbi:MBL fold metallo-hydrolase [Altererythrobacter salegens]|uniref:MBL fold metallo-hydrolase n=1 Tax=Croceibacterium salegens TaxID=1737568 RepID=A0A6I4SZ56_9SPHN|nr:MBL fold metallo-hydrolase [Croceibacterium salegens]MXO60659.1 MBL fold metallo-hydrolase [Croceibacterium salegens]
MLKKAIIAAAIATSLASSTVAAQEDTATVEIVTLGTGGGPTLRANRSQAASLVRVGEAYYLMDAGIGTSRQMTLAGVQAQMLNAVFITHNHADHSQDLVNIVGARLLARMGEARREEPLAIYGPPGIRAMVDEAVAYALAGPLENFQLFTGEIPDPAGTFEVYEISTDGVILDTDGLTVEAIENSHYQLLPANQRETQKSYSYRLQTDAGVIVFTGDTGPDGAWTEILRNADVVVAESSNVEAIRAMMARAASVSADVDPVIANANQARLELLINHSTRQHIPADQLGELAQGMGVRALILNHFGPETDIVGTDQNVAQVRRAYLGQIEVSEDLAQYCLRRSPTEGISTLTTCPSSAGSDDRGNQ